MKYSFTTPIGTFAIRPQRNNPNRVELWVGDECYGSYASARMAASDVYAHVTGFNRWDMAAHLEVPEDLAERKQS